MKNRFKILLITVLITVVFYFTGVYIVYYHVNHVFDGIVNLIIFSAYGIFAVQAIALLLIFIFILVFLIISKKLKNKEYITGSYYSLSYLLLLLLLFILYWSDTN